MTSTKPAVLQAWRCLVDFVCIFYIFVSSLLDFASFISFTFCVGNIVYWLYTFDKLPCRVVGTYGSVSVEYYNQISTYGINGCRSTCVAASGRD